MDYFELARQGRSYPALTSANRGVIVHRHLGATTPLLQYNQSRAIARLHSIKHRCAYAIMSEKITSITDLPLDILVLIFPSLDAKSFLSLCSTCKAFQQPSIRLDPAYWSYATRSTFRIPNQPVVQHDGQRWQKMYRRLLTVSLTCLLSTLSMSIGRIRNYTSLKLTINSKAASTHGEAIPIAAWAIVTTRLCLCYRGSRVLGGEE